MHVLRHEYVSGAHTLVKIDIYFDIELDKLCHIYIIFTFSSVCNCIIIIITRTINSVIYLLTEIK